MTISNIVSIYTDGACSGNQNTKNLGGWGAILEFQGHTKEIFGAEANTTNNRMELMGLISALEALTKDGQIIHVYSDSSYVINCMQKKWYENWRRNGWKTASKTPVENQDLWERLLELTEKHSLKYYRVKGHVDPDRSFKLDSLYKKFLEMNSGDFSYDDFIYITKQNNRADALANKGIDSIR
jgi:ribonuclease HI